MKIKALFNPVNTLMKSLSHRFQLLLVAIFSIAVVLVLIFLLAKSAMNQINFTKREMVGIEQIGPMVDKIQELQNMRNGETSEIEASQITKQISQLLEDIIHVADGTNITLDPSLVTTYLMDTYVVRLPVFIEETSLINYLSSKTDTIDTRSHILALKVSMKELHKNAVEENMEKVFRLDPTLTSDLKGLNKKFTEQATKAFDILDNHLEVNKDDLIDFKLKNIFNDLISTSWLFEKEIGLAIDRLLNNRLSELRSELILSIFIMSFVLFSLIYLLTGLASHLFDKIDEQKKVEKMKREFISLVSHELRTPLTSIKGAIELLHDRFSEKLSHKGVQLLKIANNNCERLSLLINDILDFEKYESGKISFNFKPVNLKNIIIESIKNIQPYANQFHVTLIFNEGADLIISGDEGRLIQAMNNLLSNAIKFSYKNGSVVVTALEVEGAARVRVKDCGRGIAENIKPHIFEKFIQADDVEKRGVASTGLGLAITKAIITNHHGTIHFTSAEEGGTTFYFDIPLYKDNFDDILSGDL